MFDIMTPAGIVTVVIDERKCPPFRVYDRNGMEVDPSFICYHELEEMCHVAYDLSDLAIDRRVE